ncbi:MAG: DNA repair protein RecN [Gemmatimonadota bacterium]|nr:MAG: DNA repair protein RecN [Gemmatimonadota bacterium]
MLSELRVKNYAVIEDLDLRFEPGLVVLTGETGAGKSIIVGALSLVLGERATSDVIRAGEERALIEAVFDVSGRDELRRRCEEAGVDVEDGWLVLKREVNASGRSRAWVNASPATAALTGELGRALVDIHGQHEHQALLHAGPQREILDEYSGAGELARQLRDCWARLNELREEREAVEARRARTEERAEFLGHQVSEIEGARLSDPEEDLRLADEERRLAHAEELLERSHRLYDEIYGADGSLYERLGRLRRELDALGRVDPVVESQFGELFDGVYFSLQELGSRLSAYRESIDLNPGTLERTRQRIDALYRLKSKYGPTLAAVMESFERAATELSELDLAEQRLEELSRRESELVAELEELARQLSRARSKAAKGLSGEVTGILPELGMPDGRFEVALLERASIKATGAEDIEFRVTLNKGFDPLPLSKVASGGELSRVMLALKTILARLDRTATLIFDEIDAGIGGIVGQKVAERLKLVAAYHQVFVITHLAQIAALADHHLLVTKESKKRKSTTIVSELEGEDRVRDLARMLGGDPERKASLEHARALLAPSAGASRAG